MFNNVPVLWQYLILAGVALALTVAGLWLYNRREKRRKHAIELMKLMNRWGLDWFADLYEDYAVGDYSGLVVKVKEIVTGPSAATKRWSPNWGDVARKVAAYYATSDAAKAQELMAILQKSPGGKP